MSKTKQLRKELEKNEAERDALRLRARELVCEILASEAEEEASTNESQHIVLTEGIEHKGDVGSLS